MLASDWRFAKTHEQANQGLQMSY